MAHIILRATARVAIAALVRKHTERDPDHKGYFRYKEHWSHLRVANEVNAAYGCLANEKHVHYQIKTEPDLKARPFWKPRFDKASAPAKPVPQEDVIEGINARLKSLDMRFDAVVKKEVAEQTEALTAKVAALEKRLADWEDLLLATTKNVAAVEYYLTGKDSHWRDTP